MKVRLKTIGTVELPTKATEGSAGYDVRVRNLKKVYKGSKEVEENVVEALRKQFIEKGNFTLRPFERCLMGTDIVVADMPINLEIQVRPRSGISLKRGLQVSFGTVDSDYRGEIGIIITNTTPFLAQIEFNERMAQLVPKEVCSCELVEEIGEVSKTTRGEKGFGSTNTN